MVEYLTSVFGAGISAAEWELPPRAPFYLRDGYTFSVVAWNNQKCLLVKPKMSSVRLPTLKKQFSIVKSLTEYPCALVMDELTSQQRKNLLTDHIPFVAAPYQVYFPFWGCSFTAQFKTHTTPEGLMTPTTQLVFLYLFYTLNGGRTTAAKISDRLGLAKVSVARAIDDFVSSGLFAITVEGTRKWISMPANKSEQINTAIKRMRTPVEKTIYISTVPRDAHYMIGGVRALAQFTMINAGELDGCLVYSKKGFTSLQREYIISEKDFLDFGGHPVEVWSYDPNLLSAGERVDDLSLLLSLSDNSDERIQMCVDTIRTKYGLSIPTQE